MSEAIEGTPIRCSVATIDFPFYRGRAGVRQVGEVIQAAYLGRKPRLAGTVEGLVDGAPYRVTDAADSKDTAGMIRLTLAAVDDQPPP